jgi:hypothetical protein
MGGYGLEPTLSMHQYAMRQLEDGDSAAGLEAFDREAVPIENWLAAQADRQKRGEAAALFIFVISIGMALVGSMLSSALTAPSAFVAVIAVARMFGSGWSSGDWLQKGMILNHCPSRSKKRSMASLEWQPKTCFLAATVYLILVAI